MFKLSDGNFIPEIGYGTYKVNSAEVIYDAIKTGYKHIDTAQYYFNEEFVGEAVRSAERNSIIKREDIFITTKVWHSNFEKDDCKASIDESLKKLQVDYIDLVLLHWPFGNYYAAWRVLEDYKDRGIIRSIGVSNMSASQIIDLGHFNKYKPVVNQIETHLYNQQIEERKWLRKYGVQTIAYAPLGRTWFPEMLNEDSVVRIAEKYGKTTRQIALRFLIEEGIAVIPKTVNKDRMVENLSVIDFEMDDSEIESLRKLNRDTPYCGKLNDPENTENMIST